MTLSPKGFPSSFFKKHTLSPDKIKKPFVFAQAAVKKEHKIERLNCKTVIALAGFSQSR
jgi:hypothetical protein